MYFPDTGGGGRGGRVRGAMEKTPPPPPKFGFEAEWERAGAAKEGEEWDSDGEESRMWERASMGRAREEEEAEWREEGRSEGGGGKVSAPRPERRNGSCCCRYASPPAPLHLESIDSLAEGEGSVEDHEEIVEEVESRRSQADETEEGMARGRSLLGGKEGSAVDERELFLLNDAIPGRDEFDQSVRGGEARRVSTSPSCDHPRGIGGESCCRG